MKKVICLLLVVVLAIGLLCGCEGYNRQVIDLTYSYEYAYITLPNGESVEGKVGGWVDYENSDVVQVVIDGKTYLTHYANVVLVSE